MTEPPPKKRSFFKKAAWQTAVKPEGQDKDIFSHSNEYKDIVAEQARRKQEEKQKVADERKRKADEERERKRRKVSVDVDEPTWPGSGSGSSTRASRTESKGRSRTPLSPVRTESRPDSLSARYDSLTKSPSTGALPGRPSEIIDLGDSDADCDPEDSTFKPSKHPSISIPRLPSKPAPSEDLEEIEDPVLAALAAKARARAANKTVAPASAIHADAPKVAVVQLLITSNIPNSNALLVKIKTDSTIEKPREAWCSKQGFSPAMTQGIFLTWKNKKLFDSTTIARLGVHVDSNGCISVKDDSQIYDEHDLPKIHLEAWTEDLFEQWKREEAAEAAAKRKAAELLKAVEEEPVEEPVAETPKMRLILKAKGKADFRICVKPDTTFSHLTTAYKEKWDIPQDQPITLMFDGDRLRPMDTVGDADIDDMDSLEVHFK